MYVKLTDPQDGNRIVKEVSRSDGKRIKLDNVWLSKTRDESHIWHHFVNLFDANTPGIYTIVYDDALSSSVPQPPVLQYIPDRMRPEGEQLSFIVEASDPNGILPKLSAAPLPAGALFTDQGDGVAIFDWTPAVGQSGRYEITYTASDGVLTDSQRAVITVCSAADSDCDGMDDQWELDHFDILDRDGTGDFDGDGVSDLDEFLNEADPTESGAPSIPVIFDPADSGEVVILQPVLVIENSIDPNGDTVTYEFELYADEAMTER
jgi:hypothetical protein